MTGLDAPAHDSAGGAVRFARLERGGVLLGRSAGQVGCLAAAVVIAVAALYGGGASAVAWTAPGWGVALAVAFATVAGRPLVAWLPVTAAFTTRRLTGGLRHRARIGRPQPEATLSLPHGPAALPLLGDTHTGAGLVLDRSAGQLVAVARITHHSFVLLDAAEQQRRIDAWGRVLAGAARSSRLARLQLVERTLPDHGSGLTAWWARHGTDHGSWVAATYRDLIARAGPAGEQHICTVSVALDLHAAAAAIRHSGGGIDGAATVLRREMAALARALSAAELGPVSWVTPAELADTVRAAYDPFTHRRGVPDGGVQPDHGPTAVDEEWDRLRADAAWHAVLWIAEWPRSLVLPGFLAPLVFSGGVRRTISVLCDPVPADLAAREIRRRKTAWVADAAHRDRIGQIADARDHAEYDDLLRQEAELTAGHALLHHTGLIAVSAPTAEQLEAAVAEIEQAAVQACCETRRLHGQQAAAFHAAALPLCRPI